MGASRARDRSLVHSGQCRASWGGAHRPAEDARSLLADAEPSCPCPSREGHPCAATRRKRDSTLPTGPPPAPRAARGASRQGCRGTDGGGLQPRPGRPKRRGGEYPTTCAQCAVAGAPRHLGHAVALRRELLVARPFRHLGPFPYPIEKGRAGAPGARFLQGGRETPDSCQRHATGALRLQHASPPRFSEQPARSPAVPRFARDPPVGVMSCVQHAPLSGRGALLRRALAGSCSAPGVGSGLPFNNLVAWGRGDVDAPGEEPRREARALGAQSQPSRARDDQRSSSVWCRMRAMI